MKEMRIYKPKKSGDGGASKFQLSTRKVKRGEGEYDRTFLFLQTAKQTGIDDKGNASFAWKDAGGYVTMKLEERDIGDLLAVLNGVKGEVGLGEGIYHQNPKGSTVLNFGKYVKDGNLLGYNLRLSKKAEGEPVAISHTLSVQEGEVLRVLLQQALIRFYGW